MARNRVFSLVSQFREPRSGPVSPPPEKVVRSSSSSSSSPSQTPSAHQFVHRRRSSSKSSSAHSAVVEPFPDIHPSQDFDGPPAPPTPPRSISGDDEITPASGSRRNSSVGRNRSVSRPSSILQAYQPPLMDIDEETIPELQPVFGLLNSNGNKLYQEGYFLKLDDQNSQGRTNTDRTWHECFAQLVGTVLSLWDAADLDAAGENGEVLPKFINLTDASIKMIDSLKITDDNDGLQNILSVSTAGRNRYLLHFNSHQSMIQWTAAIRLSMFENSALQEAYTGALIAGKGRLLNNIGIIMERQRLPYKAWMGVRFGAGVPWRRCCAVITPPSAKDIQKAQKDAKRNNPYNISAPVLRGNIKFYDTDPTDHHLLKKKTTPIASITDAYSAYATYPQSKKLIDASTLIKIEGEVTIHSDPPSTTEGLVFIMPETRPAVSGFETLLSVLFPILDTFALYGRPGKLVASTLDPRSLMYAMPKHKRHGYLDNLDVANLITSEGSSRWGEREWRKRMKEAVGQRMAEMEQVGGSHQSQSRSGSRRSVRLSFGSGSSAPGLGRPRVGFADDSTKAMTVRSSRSQSVTGSPASSPPGSDRLQSRLKNIASRHSRNSSDSEALSVSNRRGAAVEQEPETDVFPSVTNSPQRGTTPVKGILRDRTNTANNTMTVDGIGSDDERPLPPAPPLTPLGNLHMFNSPDSVSSPPAFNHDQRSQPTGKLHHSPELRRATSRLSISTYAQLAKAGRVSINMDSSSDGVSVGGQQPGLDPRNFENDESRPGRGYRRSDLTRFGTDESAELGSPTMQRQIDPDISRLYLPRHPGTNVEMDHAQFRRPGPPGPVPHRSMGRGSLSPPMPPNHGRPGINQAPYSPSLHQTSDIMGAGPRTGFSGGPGLANDNVGFQPLDSDDYFGPPRRPLPPTPSRSSPKPIIKKSRPHDSGPNTSLSDASAWSADTREMVDQPRAGVLKTVGGAESPSLSLEPTEYKVPDVDFGSMLGLRAPTYSRPPTGSPSHLRSPNQITQSAGHHISPPIGEPCHVRQASDDTIGRTARWSPGSSAGSRLSGGPTFTPKQFVEHMVMSRSPEPAPTPLRAGPFTPPKLHPGVTERYSSLEAMTPPAGRMQRTPLDTSPSHRLQQRDDHASVFAAENMLPRLHLRQLPAPLPEFAQRQVQAGRAGSPSRMPRPQPQPQQSQFQGGQAF